MPPEDGKPPEVELEAFHGLSLNINMGGKRVGFIDAWELEEDPRRVWVEYAYVLKGLRNSGIGTRAMRMALTRWREMGYVGVSLDDIHWEATEDFWGRLGFTGEGKRKRLEL
jgi:GNAT superfamily N-acetyltransferase